MPVGHRLVGAAHGVQRVFLPGRRGDVQADRQAGSLENPAGMASAGKPFRLNAR